MLEFLHHQYAVAYFEFNFQGASGRTTVAVAVDPNPHFELEGVEIDERTFPQPVTGRQLESLTPGAGVHFLPKGFAPLEEEIISERSGSIVENLGVQKSPIVSPQNFGVRDDCKAGIDLDPPDFLSFTAGCPFHQLALLEIFKLRGTNPKPLASTKGPKVGPLARLAGAIRNRAGLREAGEGPCLEPRFLARLKPNPLRLALSRRGVAESYCGDRQREDRCTADYFHRGSLYAAF